MAKQLLFDTEARQRVLDAVMGLDRAPDMRALEAAVCMASV